MAGLQNSSELRMVEPLSCDLSALSLAQRKRHSELIRYVLSEPLSLKELAEGYELSFKNEAEVFLKIAEWVVLERVCCPFLSFSLPLDRGDGPIRVLITGPAGTKDVLKAAYGTEYSRPGHLPVRSS